MADEVPQHAVSIRYCDEHYEALRQALVERQLGQMICNSEEELMQRLLEGGMDPLLESGNAITSAALQMFGPHALVDGGGCPICCFHRVIVHVADHMAVRYKASN